MQAEELEGSTLYVVATPIGNLRDVTLRALDVLRAATHIAAEDTRHSRRLLDHYGIDTPLISAHEHNEVRAAEQVIGFLAQGESVALISDAGTPAVSDPGALLVHRVRAAGYRVVPIPGPSALLAALSAAGIASTQFVFHGFLSTKAEARKRELVHYRDATAPVIFYEAPHRILETFSAMLEVFGADRRITVGRELTKAFESIHETSLGEIMAWVEADSNRLKGEFVLIVHGLAPAADVDDAQLVEGRRVLSLLIEEELSASQAARLAAKITGARKNALYDEAVRLASHHDE